MPSRFETRFRQRSVPILEREFGVTVYLSRGALVTEPFTVRRGTREHSAMGAEHGLEIKVTMRDYILPVASLLIDGDEIEPRTGDRITEGSEVFEIQPPDDNTPSVALQSGSFEYLVHTKRIQ